MLRLFYPELVMLLDFLLFCYFLTFHLENPLGTFSILLAKHRKKTKKLNALPYALNLEKCMTFYFLGPTVCFSKAGFSDNGTMFYNFTCPMLDQDPEMSNCCGPSDEQRCCKTDDEKEGHTSDDHIMYVILHLKYTDSMSYT